MTDFLCDVCKAPIEAGEPVVLYQGGALAHRFKTVCERIIRERKEKDESSNLCKGKYN